MTGWTAIIPLKLGGDCKTRLAGRLSRAERNALVAAMARHVVPQVRAAAGVSEVRIFSPQRPDFAGTSWLADKGRGLNHELGLLLSGERMLVINADLPMLVAGEVEALIESAARDGAAIAPDRAGTGTNALAFRTVHGFAPVFGADSLARHRVLLPGAAIVERPGLALDVDTPEDLDFARKMGAPAIA